MFLSIFIIFYKKNLYKKYYLYKVDQQSTTQQHI